MQGEFKGESATPDAVVMAYYEKPDSQAPKGYVTVEAGELSAKPPKKKRKGAAHCMRVDQCVATTQSWPSAQATQVSDKVFFAQERVEEECAVQAGARRRERRRPPALDSHIVTV